MFEKLHGQYVLHTKDDETKSLLLFLVYDGKPISIDLTQTAVGQGLEFSDQVLRYYRNVCDFYAQTPAVNTNDWRDIPTLLGGDSNNDLLVLHTDDEAKSFASKLFTLTPIDEFVSRYDGKPLPLFLVPVVGYHAWPEWLLLASIATKTLDLRLGLHPLAYGVNLDRKCNLPELLFEHLTPVSARDGETQEETATRLVQNLTGTIFDYMSLIMPAMAHAGVGAFVRSELPDLSEDDTYQATRMCLAITELEGKGALENMKSIKAATFSDLEKRFSKLFLDETKLKLLGNFEKNYAAYKNLGLNPYIVDAYTAQIFTAEAPRKPPTKRSRVGTLKTRLKQFSNVIKRKGASDGE